MSLTRRSFLGGLPGFGAAARTGSPPLSFGILADVQYADKDTSGKREYRASIAKLEKCVAALRRERLAFTVQLGDLVDAGLENLDRVLPCFRPLRVPVRHVLGNHDLAAGRTVLLKRLGLPNAYYDFSVANWRFVVLNGMELNARSELGRATLAELKAAAEKNAFEWNGGLGEAQRVWLRRTLQNAAAKDQHAILFCHHPVLAASSTPEHLLWDHREVLEIVKSSPAPVAWFNGHDHRGGYAAESGIHFLTLRGMVEHTAEESCSVVEVHPGRLVLRRPGHAGGKPLPYPAAD
ncbi:MAG: metallophosphoesterase [Bryobacterales bacterium]|nr:metallophosphoesterase [Bryobacterales bacterium]